MRSRARVAFRPGMDCPDGPDWLECRRLLSAAAVATEPSAKASVVVATPPVSPSSSEVSASQHETEEEETHSESISGPVDSFGTVSGATTTPSLDAIEVTTGDESPTGLNASPSGTGPAGGTGATMGVVGSPAGTADGPNPDASPASASSMSSGTATSTATAGRPVGDGLQTAPIVVDGALLADVRPTTEPGHVTTAPNGSYHDPDGPGGDVVHEDHGDTAEPASSAPSQSASEPSPRCADLLTEFLPFDRAALDQAIDRFLTPLEDLGSELAAWEPPAGLIPVTAIVAGAALTAEVARRRAHSNTVVVAATVDSREEFVRFPGYPWAWSIRKS